MGYIGRTPTGSILTSADIADGSISTAKLEDSAVTTAKITDNAVTAAKYVEYPAYRNLIINGDMSIAQRGTSVSSYGSVAYSTVDRFKTVFEVGTYTVSQESLSSGEAYNNGFRKAFKALVTSTASPPSAGSQTTFEQRIEGQMCQAIKKGTSNAESLTLSFWVRSSKTGSNLQVNLRDTDNTRQVGGTYNISSADTWEKKTITFPPDTTGALNNDNGTSLIIEWFLDGGSNYSGGAVPTSWEASSNADRNVTNFDLAGATNDWWITGVQLEVGTSASDFEFLPHDVNFDRCMRYYFEEGGDDPKGFVAIAFGTSDSPFRYEFKKPMRAAPTGSYAGVIDNDIALYHNGGWRTLTAMSFTSMTVNGARVEINSSGAFSTGRGGHVYLLNGVGKFKFDAEL